ncbi:MAG TPA: cyclase family protein [Gaiellaceae bacterium]
MRVLDLTHAFDNGMPVFPGLPDPSFEPIAKVEEDGYAMTRYAMLNHIGTHVDAPAHQIAGGDTLDEIGLERLVTDAIRIDVSHRDPHGSIPLDEIRRQLDDVRAGDIVLFYSNNARNYGTEAYWTGWSYPDADASRALIELGVSAVGFDGPSADPVDTTTFDLHRIWLSAGRMILENVNNLDQLPARAQLVVAPMKVARANGAPTRIFALLPN